MPFGCVGITLAWLTSIEGGDYPADKLHSYKSLHETRTAHELAGIHVPFGWVDSLTIRSLSVVCW